MSETPTAEAALKIALMTIQIEKAQFDMQMDAKKYRLQLWGIVVSVVGLVIADFAAGHFIR